MKAIDEARLNSDLPYRFEYLTEFIGFESEDAAAVQASAPYLGPLIPQIVEKTYEKLLTYDATARHFVPRQSGFDGPTPPSLTDLQPDHPQLRFRKDHLLRYFMQLLGRPFDAKLVPYLDMVGKIHTPNAGNAEINVPVVQMNAFMGFLSDVIIEMISSLDLDPRTMIRTIRAFNKVLWLQQDFITRHYQASSMLGK